MCVCAAGVDCVEKKRERIFNVAWTQHSCQAHTLRNERSVQCFLLIIIFRKSIQIWKERTLNKVISERLWAQLPCTMAAMLVHAAWTWTGTHQFTCESHRAVHNLIPGRKINMRNTVCCSHSTQTHTHTFSSRNRYAICISLASSVRSLGTHSPRLRCHVPVLLLLVPCFVQIMCFASHRMRMTTNFK